MLSFIFINTDHISHKEIACTAADGNIKGMSAFGKMRQIFQRDAYISALKSVDQARHYLSSQELLLGSANKNT